MANQDHSNDTPEQKPSLYDRLGGVYAIAAVMDDSSLIASWTIRG
jgi:hypothetical protein